MLKIFVDGSCNASTYGDTGVGVVVKKDGETKAKVSKNAGEGTNNTAEYKAVINGLKKALEFNEDKVKIFSDSELIVKQLNGEYKIKQPHLIELWEEVQEVSKKFDEVEYEWIPREKNWVADKLAKRATNL